MAPVALEGKKHQVGPPHSCPKPWRDPPAKLCGKQTPPTPPGIGIHNGQEGACPRQGPPATANLRMLAPNQQRTMLLLHPHRIIAVTHVVEAQLSHDPPLLVVRDGPTNAEVTNLPATWAGVLPHPTPPALALSVHPASSLGHLSEPPPTRPLSRQVGKQRAPPPRLWPPSPDPGANCGVGKRSHHRGRVQANRADIVRTSREERLCSWEKALRPDRTPINPHPMPSPGPTKPRGPFSSAPAHDPGGPRLPRPLAEHPGRYPGRRGAGAPRRGGAGAPVEAAEGCSGFDRVHV